MSEGVQIDNLADLTIARLRSHEGRESWARLARRGAPRSVRLAAAISAVSGPGVFIRGEDLIETIDAIDTRILSGALNPGGYGDSHFVGERTAGVTG